MPTVIPYIPETITVHLGPPDSDAANVTVYFSDYVKNVASSEIYPTWSESALRANILAITSFALNRVYTEFYRSRGYDFDITSSTAYDQSFVSGRNVFQNISRLADEMFDDYLRRAGTVEPLAAKFCNGTTVTCEGLSQWGSQALAEQGYTAEEILRAYYGEDVEIVTDAPVQPLAQSYPGAALRRGDTGPDVTVVQVSLDRIAQNYPAIPKISPIDGIFGAQTEASVRRFQSIFDLEPDGIVGRATWYALVRLYVAVTRLAELQSQGQRFYGVAWEYPDAIVRGDTGEKVEQLQYMLAVAAEFDPLIPAIDVTGTFDDPTFRAVTAFQRGAGLPDNGVVGRATWDALYRAFSGVEQTVFQDAELFPYTAAQESPAPAQTAARTLSQPRAQPQRRTRAGTQAPRTAAAQPSAPAARGTSRPTQFPGYDLHPGHSDHNQSIRRQTI